MGQAQAFPMPQSGRKQKKQVQQVLDLMQLFWAMLRRFAFNRQSNGVVSLASVSFAVGALSGAEMPKLFD